MPSKLKFENASAYICMVLEQFCLCVEFPARDSGFALKYFDFERRNIN